jgi:hypothetical protein
MIYQLIFLLSHLFLLKNTLFLLILYVTIHNKDYIKNSENKSYDAQFESQFDNHVIEI